MALLLQGKVAAITGAVTGIGRAIAIEYLRQGAKVVVNHFPDEKSREHFSSLQAEVGTVATARLGGVAGDISKPETGRALVQEAVNRFGRLDIFVSNAGVCEFADFLTISSDLVNSTISTNLNGAFFAVQAAARQMAKQEPSGGSIIGISSISALVGGARQAHYTPTKAGVLSLMQSAACALGRHGVRCNALLPGTIETQLNEEDLAVSSKRDYMESRIPLGRVGVPADLAGPAVFLASDMSKYVTGAHLLVDGGLFVNLQRIPLYHLYRSKDGTKEQKHVLKQHEKLSRLTITFQIASSKQVPITWPHKHGATFGTNSSETRRGDFRDSLHIKWPATRARKTQTPPPKLLRRFQTYATTRSVFLPHRKNGVA